MGAAWALIAILGAMIGGFIGAVAGGAAGLVLGLYTGANGLFLLTLGFVWWRSRAGRSAKPADVAPGETALSTTESALSQARAQHPRAASLSTTF
jgi:hypothetical protein